MKADGEKGRVREPAVAGSFYPGDKTSLSKEVDRLLESARVKELDGEILGLVVPHAGYMFSGGVAAAAYKQLEGRSYDFAILLGPSHRAYFPEASVYPGPAFRTPLGLVGIDEEVSEELARKETLIKLSSSGHAGEHSLEVQLPFLQKMMPGMKIVPILLGVQTRIVCEKVARALSLVLDGRNALILASSDLSHFHRYDEAVKLDRTAIKHLESFDPYSLLDDLEKDGCEACGGGPVVTMLLTARSLGATGVEVLMYANSGDVAGGRESVVGYCAAAVLRKKSVVDVISKDDKRKLLDIARKSIRSYLLTGRRAEPSEESGALEEKKGAFVTLKKSGELRGCIGHIHATKPLYITVSDMAVEAAFYDPRFEPLDEEEFDEIEIEISILSPMEKVKDPREIETGKHGVYLQKDFHSALYLPQVATENNWGLEEFLDNLCLKAGLPKGSWREAELSSFTAEVFGEE